MPGSRLPLLAAVIALVVGAPVATAAPWSAPVDLGTAGDYVSAPVLAFAAQGGGIVGWQIRRQPAGAGGLPGAFDVTYQGDNDGFRGRLAALGLDGTPGPVQTLTDGLVAGPVLDASGRGLVLRNWVLASDPNANRRQRITWSARSAGGVVGKAHTLVVATLVAPPSLAMDARGDALAAWSEYRPPTSRRRLWGSFRIRAAWRAPGHGFGRPVTLFDTEAIDYEHNGQVTVAIGPDGRGLVVFPDAHETRHGVRAAVLAWAGTRRRGFGRTLNAGPSSGYAQAAAAIAPDGRAYVAWGTQDGGEEANEPWIVRAASLAPGATRFSAAQTLDPGAVAERPMGRVVLAAGADGRATVAWTGVRRGEFPVQAASSTAAGRFAAPQVLAASGAVGGVAIRADGAAIVTWAHAVQYQMTDQAMAAIRPAGAAGFGPPEAIADPDVAGPPAAGFDPRSGRPVVAWPSRPAGHDPSQGVATTAVLRLAVRDAP